MEALPYEGAVALDVGVASVMVDHPVLVGQDQEVEAHEGHCGDQEGEVLWVEACPLALSMEEVHLKRNMS